MGGGGVHVLCSIIDAVILFGTRHLQIAARVPTWASKMNAGTLTVPLRYWLVSRAIKRAQKRVSFDLGPIEVNQTELQQLDLEGPSGTQIKWFNQQSQGRRAQWISLLERKLNPLYKERERLKEEIMDSSPSPWHQRRLNVVESQILKIATLKRKGFLGSRYKRFFFLKARRGKTHLKGQAPIEGALQKDFLWIASVQQNILHRGLISNDQNEIKKDFIAAQRLSTESIDPILLGLAEESAFDEGLMKALLADVESIFDVTQSKKIRYLRILLIEGALTQIGYKFLNWKVESVPTGEGGWLSRTARAARFRWSAGQFVKHVYEYTDFLRIAAASNSESFQIKHKYEAMESLIRIFDHLKKQDEIFNQYSNITEMLRPLKESNGKLSTFKPWLEKKTSYSWIPFKKSYPQCDEMWGTME